MRWRKGLRRWRSDVCRHLVRGGVVGKKLGFDRYAGGPAIN